MVVRFRQYVRLLLMGVIERVREGTGDWRSVGTRAGTLAVVLRDQFHAAERYNFMYYVDCDGGGCVRGANDFMRGRFGRSQLGLKDGILSMTVIVGESWMVFLEHFVACVDAESRLIAFVIAVLVPLWRGRHVLVRSYDHGFKSM